MYRLIFVDMDIVVIPAPDTAPGQPAGELRVIRTGEQTVDGSRRYYYAANPPRRLLIVARNGSHLESAHPGQYWQALIGWDDGDNAYVLSGDEGKRHTKLTIDLLLDVPLPGAVETTPLSTVVDRAPRSDRPGGVRGVMAGRPPVAVGDRVERHNVTLPSLLWRRVEQAGGGNRSGGIRNLIEGVAPMHVYEVGKPYIPGRTQWPEIGEYNFRGGEHELRLFFSQPSAQEIANVARGRAEFGLFVEDEQIIFLYRFGHGEWSDAPFSIHRVPASERVLPQPLSGEQRMALNVMLVSADDGIVRALRFVSFSPEFSQRLHAALQAQAALPFDQAAYDANLARIYELNTSPGLAGRAVVRCRGGE